MTSVLLKRYLDDTIRTGRVTDDQTFLLERRNIYIYIYIYI